MKLRDAPVIVHAFNPDAGWFLAAASRARKLFDAALAPTMPAELGLAQLDQDVWGCEGCLPIHTDRTKRGFRVFGLVLANDGAFNLVQGGEIWKIPSGTVYHIDGRAPHGALKWGHGLNMGRFLFMAWDVHRDENVEELIASVPESMGAFAAGEERIDVSTAAKPL